MASSLFEDEHALSRVIMVSMENHPEGWKPSDSIYAIGPTYLSADKENRRRAPNPFRSDPIQSIHLVTVFRVRTSHGPRARVSQSPWRSSVRNEMSAHGGDNPAGVHSLARTRHAGWSRFLIMFMHALTLTKDLWTPPCVHICGFHGDYPFIRNRTAKITRRTEQYRVIVKKTLRTLSHLYHVFQI